jgi:hypothetical protein
VQLARRRQRETTPPLPDESRQKDRQPEAGWQEDRIWAGQQTSRFENSAESGEEEAKEKETPSKNQ